MLVVTQVSNKRLENSNISIIIIALIKGMYRPPPRPQPKNPFFAIFASIAIFGGIFVAIFLVGRCVEKIQEWLNKKSLSSPPNTDATGQDIKGKKDQ